MYCFKCGTSLNNGYICTSCGYDNEKMDGESLINKAQRESSAYAERHLSEIAELQKKLKSQVIELIRMNSKLHAVQLYMDATGSGLKESKEYVDSVEKEIKIITSPKTEVVLDNQLKSNSTNSGINNTGSAKLLVGAAKLFVVLFLVGSAIFLWIASHSASFKSASKPTEIESSSLSTETKNNINAVEEIKNQSEEKKVIPDARKCEWCNKEIHGEPYIAKFRDTYGTASRVSESYFCNHDCYLPYVAQNGKDDGMYTESGIQ
jgi:ribosomal protein L7/L12